MPLFKTLPLTGWGRIHPQDCQVARPERQRDLLKLLDGGSSLIARGMGRSYGDASINPLGVALQTRLNRMLSFNAESGVLHCQGGTTLAEIIDVFLPRGFFPPVTPGTQFVTVGGAIAADVHGKNHHKVGSFSSFVHELELLTADGAVLTLSPTRDSDLFWATVGGMGLTGIIISAKLQLDRIASAYVAVDYQRAGNLHAALDAFGNGDDRYDFSVAWIDCLAGGDALGRSVLMRGNVASPAELPPSLREQPLGLRPARSRQVPFNLPSFLLNRATVGAFNWLYYRRHSDGKQIVPYTSFFYPLDSMLDWNRLYGQRGFIQYQAFFPHETSRGGLTVLLQHISASKRASFLAVLKSCGPASQGILSFLRPGHTLALDLPMTPGIAALHARLDQIVLRHGGRLYLAKDALMARDVFREMYPELPRFHEIKRRVDPNNRFTSALARRLGIVEGE